MKNTTHDKLLRDWARLGSLFGVNPSRETPDLERLLLQTASEIPSNARLLPVIATWLTVYGDSVARHRLARLIRDELPVEHQPALGLLLETAIAQGAPAGLRVAAKACEATDTARPLHIVRQGNDSLSRIAKETASELSLRWGVWAPEIELKADAVRPASWVLDRNPVLRDRIIRKGDLRASILASLRWDTPGRSAPSVQSISRLTGATRTAVRAALDALTLELAVTVGVNPMNDRDQPVRLLAA